MVIINKLWYSIDNHKRSICSATQKLTNLTHANCLNILPVNKKYAILSNSFQLSERRTIKYTENSTNDGASISIFNCNKFVSFVINLIEMKKKNNELINKSMNN